MLSQDIIDTLFLKARSQNSWQQKSVSDTQIKKIYDLMKFCPTAANCCPLRLNFLKSNEAKQRLKPHLDEGNIEKSMTAPVMVIFSYDTEFYEQLPFLFPHTDARSWFAGKPEKIKQSGTFNATLQIGYFILTTRLVGLDCAPMGGFSTEGIDKEFFNNGKQKSLLISGIGYGGNEKLFSRSPRLNFDQACQIV